MHKPLILIAAMGSNRVIGSGDGMPWSVPEEYSQFLRFVQGNIVLMGRRSFEIFGADLKECRTIVISHSARDYPDALCCASVTEALAQAQSLEGAVVFSAGGATIYEQTLPLATDLYLSTIHGDFAGDTYFPDFDRSEWTVVASRPHDRFLFEHYQRRPR